MTMAFIGNKEKNFRKYLENHFGIALPAEVAMFYAGGVRVGNREIVGCKINGEMGYAACDAGFNPTNAMAQNFGHLATKNTVTLDAAKAREFALGRGIGSTDMGPKSHFVIVKYEEFVVGLGYYDAEEKKVKNKIPEKRRRKIVNEL